LEDYLEIDEGDDDGKKCEVGRIARGGMENVFFFTARYSLQLSSGEEGDLFARHHSISILVLFLLEE
jgi:hypothetical protein